MRQERTELKSGNSESRSGVRDEMYDVISVIYHCLQGVETYSKYAEDARSAGNEELASFFEKVCDSERKCALSAKRFLKDWVSEESEEDVSQTRMSSSSSSRQQRSQQDSQQSQASASGPH